MTVGVDTVFPLNNVQDALIEGISASPGLWRSELPLCTKS
jgi:hypothetical protein